MPIFTRISSCRALASNWQVLAWRIALIAMLMAQFTGCAHPDFKKTRYSQEWLSRPGLALTEYRLQPGDKIRLQVLEESELNGDFTINDQGEISLPLVGNIMLSGLKSIEFNRLIKQHLNQSILRNPLVSVHIIGLQPIYVGGEVRAPGKVEYAPGMTVRDVISAAGGYTYRSKYDSVFIRAKNNKQGRIFRLVGNRIPVHPGDFVRVPERFF